MITRVFALVAVSLIIASCGVWRIGGTYPGTVAPPVEVSLGELARYYAEQSNGMISLVSPLSTEFDTAVTFAWDSFDKDRIIPTSFFSSDLLQDLFTLNLESFVRESGSGDFLGAVHEFYSRQPFDPKNQAHHRPYRYLGSWGSLFFPPIKTLNHPFHFYHARFTPHFDPASVQSPFFDPTFQIRLDQETQTELTYGNELRALFNGVQSYPEKLRLVSEAKSFLYIAVMTIIADETGQELVRRMVNAKRAGVDVRLITEGFFTFSISNYCIGVLDREGIPIVRINDKSLKRLDRMFHDKFWIRDGEEAIIGGMNVLDYQNESNGFNFLNRDTDVLVRGPAVTNLLQSFINLWKQYDTKNRPIDSSEAVLTNRLMEERARGVRGSENYARWFENPETRMNGICRTAVQGNNARPQNILTVLTRYLESAQYSFYLTSPEIEFDLDSPDPGGIDRFARLMRTKASDQGMHIAYITNGIDGGLGESTTFIRSKVRDAQMMKHAFWEDMLTPVVIKEGRNVSQRVRRTIRPLIQAGVHGFQYFNYIHAKVFYFDRLLVGISSWNFDKFSAENNHEAAIFCLDENLRRQIEEQFVLDMINAVPVIP